MQETAINLFHSSSPATACSKHHGEAKTVSEKDLQEMHITVFCLAQIPASHQMILNATIVLTFQVGVWPYSQRDNQV